MNVEVDEGSGGDIGRLFGSRGVSHGAGSIALASPYVTWRDLQKEATKSIELIKMYVIIKNSNL
jgi:hypothetical protein